MKVRLKDYLNRIKEFEVELPSDATIVYTVISGDEVIHIFDNFNKEPLQVLDACSGDVSNRFSDFLDVIKVITVDELINLNKENNN